MTFYYIAIFWLVGGLIFDAVMVDVTLPFAEGCPVTDATISLAVLLTWPFVFLIGLSFGLFHQWRDGGF